MISIMGIRTKTCMSLVLFFFLLSNATALASEPPCSSMTGNDLESGLSEYTECDAHVKSVLPDSNFGLQSDLEVGMDESDGVTSETVLFVKFDLSGIDSSDLVTVADLVLACKHTQGEGLEIEAFYCSNSDWNEESITWNTAPWLDTDHQPQDVSRGTWSSGYYRFQVTNAVQRGAFLENITFVLRARSNGSESLWSYHGLPGPGMNAHLHVRYIQGDAVDPIPTDTPYSSGHLTDISLWYTWIDTGLSEIIFIAHADTEIDFFCPSVSFVVQHYFAPDGSELLVGHSVLMYELYNDTNGNGLVDADYEQGVTEVEYYFALNFSEGIVPQPVSIDDSDGVRTYRWGVRYVGVTGFLIHPLQSVDGEYEGAILTAEFLEHSYSYSLIGNTSQLKTTFKLGPILTFQAVHPGVAFEGLSLSALHTTLLFSSASDTGIFVEDSFYDSSISEFDSTPMNKAEISGNQTEFYLMSFADNYTLSTDPPSILPVTVSACPSENVNPRIRRDHFPFPLWVLQGFLNAFLPRITDSDLNLDLDYRTSGLLYRATYPQYDGLSLTHDPTYIAYLSGVPATIPTPSNWDFWILASIGGISVIAIGVYLYKKI